MQSEREAQFALLNIHSVVEMDRLTPLESLWKYCKQIRYTNLWAGLWHAHLLGRSSWHTYRGAWERGQGDSWTEERINRAASVCAPLVFPLPYFLCPFWHLSPISLLLVLSFLSTPNLPLTQWTDANDCLLQHGIAASICLDDSQKLCLSYRGRSVLGDSNSLTPRWHKKKKHGYDRQMKREQCANRTTSWGKGRENM